MDRLAVCMAGHNPTMRRFLRNNGLTLASVVFFLLFLGGQILTGQRSYNAEQKDHDEPTIAMSAYLRTGHFVEATFENWESEFLQMGSYVLLTVWLRQRGSPESKKLDETEPVDEGPEHHRKDPDAPWAVRRGGLVLALYKNSLCIAFFTLFLASLLLHGAGGAHEYSQQQQAHGGQPVTMVGFMQTSEFWFQSFQNWQSEFLAVAAIV
ncbi:MAG TPA: DUF6766 family protein, partial [Acidimicrobiales bacterium]|nr:DUF6766 family protein [Acidimicrobiales bacterium]